MHSLSVNGLSRSFGTKRILDNLSLDIQSGEILGIFGRNGCGKSTLLKVMFGTAKADSINMYYDGRPVLPKDVIPNSYIGYLPQDPFLPKGLKVRDIIPMYFNKSHLQDKVFYAPGIHRITNTKAGNLSLGELRYFELLLVGNLDHPFLMLDEPFSMVEPLYKEHIKEFLNVLTATKGIIITDHYDKDVLSISTSNILIKDGNAISIDNEGELIQKGYLPELLK
jgi:ABC-type multidrug transport system ATPase subunit